LQPDPDPNRNQLGLLGGLGRLSGALQLMERSIVAAGKTPVSRHSDGIFEGTK